MTMTSWLLRCNLIDFRWYSIIANCLIIFQSFTICLSLCTLITSLCPGTVLNAFMTWSRLSVEPTEFAIALKWSFHWLAILLSPDCWWQGFLLRIKCFYFLPEIMAFSPLNFYSINWEWSWSSFPLKKFHFMHEGSSCPTCQLCNWTTSGVPSNIRHEKCTCPLYFSCRLFFLPHSFSSSYLLPLFHCLISCCSHEQVFGSKSSPFLIAILNETCSLCSTITVKIFWTCRAI